MQMLQKNYEKMAQMISKVTEFYYFISEVSIFTILPMTYNFLTI